MIDRANEEKTLTDDEVLSTLVNPDATKTAVFEWSGEYQQRVLGALLKDENFFHAAKDVMRPNYFREQSHRSIYKALSGLYGRLGACPDVLIIEAELDLMSRKRPSDALVAKAELQACYMAFEPGLASRKHIEEQLFNFVKLQNYRECMNKTLDNLSDQRRKGQPLDFTIPDQLAKRAASLTSLGDDTGFLDPTADDFTLGENPVWIVEDFFAAGELTIWAGSSKSGKSVLWTHIINQILDGGTLFGGKVNDPDTPMLILDFENRRGYFQHWLRLASNAKTWAKISKQVFYKTKSPRPDGKGQLPAYVTVDWLSRQIEAIKKTTGRAPMVLIDTFRAANYARPNQDPNFENSAGAVGAILRPIQELAHASGAAIVILHHLNKSNSISGSGDFLGASDSVVLHYRDADAGSNVNILTRKGRYLTQTPAKVVTLEADNKFVYRGTASEYSEWQNNMADIEYRFDTAKKLICYLAANSDIEHNKGKLVDKLKSYTDRGETYRHGLISQLAKDGILTVAEGPKKSQLYSVDSGSLDRLQVWAGM